jgi:hypothetical protein
LAASVRAGVCAYAFLFIADEFLIIRLPRTYLGSLDAGGILLLQRRLDSRGLLLQTSIDNVQRARQAFI